MAVDNTISGIDANSYVSLAEANDFFLGRLYSELWSNADDTKKEQALRTATRRLDMEKYYGNKTVNNQALLFPRYNLGYLDGILLDNIIPKQLKEAQCELAIHLLSTDMSQVGVNDGKVKKEKLDGLETEYFFDKNDNVTQSNDILPPHCIALLSDFSRTVSGSSTISVGR